MHRYSILLNILDNLSSEAPKEYKSYYPEQSDLNGILKTRCLAFIHLYLKVKCGITSFRARHDLITEGAQDGGIDAYYLNTEKKILLLLQSKFRNSPENFIEKNISADELVTMEVTRVLKGEKTDSRGNEFNSKIKEFQKLWRSIPDHANYIPKVVLLANVKRYSDEQIKRLIDNANFDVFDFQKTYDELVFPLCSGTYYEPDQIEITLNLGEKEQSTLKQRISTKYGDFPVRVVFVPAKEIGRILHKYKNSILKYNPRNYLSLSGNRVNQSIRDSITKIKTNDFAILNNGITIICDTFQETSATGVVDVGQIIIKNPQIINGGQTAYTLSKVYELVENSLFDEFFEGKEVLLKAIIAGNSKNHNIKFIEEISNSTNQQSRVEEADRRSNDPIQTELQKAIYEEFGFFYERKRGEFYNGLDSKYIDKAMVIDRYDFLRSYYAFEGQPRWARQRGSETLFTEESFRSILSDAKHYREMVFSYFLLRELYEIEKSPSKEWGFGLRYGKMAIIASIGLNMPKKKITKDNLHSIILEKIDEAKGKWLKFEKWIRNRKENADYLIDEEFDFDNFYKGKTVTQNIIDYFSK